jgi:2-polyprenyl-6-methoxyphenol hydroxylase-like FAD-dependent oxidoreductase
MPRPKTVLIAGASVAGPTLAHWLERVGMEPTVVERAPQLRVGGQNVDVRGAGRIVAARTGVEEAVRAAGTGERGLAFVDARGTVQAEFPAASRAEAGRGGDGPTAELEILRGDLAQILYDHTRGRVQYRFGDRITRLDDGRRVRVGFERGREEEFDLVVAADGLHSGTRAIALPRRRDVRVVHAAARAEGAAAAARDSAHRQPPRRHRRAPAQHLGPMGAPGGGTAARPRHPSGRRARVRGDRDAAPGRPLIRRAAERAATISSRRRAAGSPSWRCR